MKINQVMDSINDDSSRSQNTKNIYIASLKRLNNEISGGFDTDNPEEILQAIKKFKPGFQNQVVSALASVSQNLVLKEQVMKINSKIKSNREKQSVRFDLDIEELREKFQEYKKKLNQDDKLLYTLLLYYPVLRRGDYYSIKFKDFDTEKTIITKMG